MLRVACLLGLLPFACFAPVPAGGLPCPDGVCPAGQACGADGVCRVDGADATLPPDAAPVLLDAAPPLLDADLSDPDLDGVATDADNCPAVANADQADADADLVGDACDNCPATANPAQGDADADLVGNLCDAELVDDASDLVVPQGETHTLAGERCYAGDVAIYGTLRVTAPGGELTLAAQTIVVAATGLISADHAGEAGGLPSTDLGGFEGQGPGGACGGGVGASVGQAGSGGSYGGVGGQPTAGTFADGPCESCSQASVAHCLGAVADPYGSTDGPDAPAGSGGSAAGNSSGCVDSGGRGGHGGGGVRLYAARRARIDGTIAASGEGPPIDSSTCGYRGGGGGGAGGTVLVAATELVGTGALVAQGGAGGEALGDEVSDWAWGGGGGGGGRVKRFAIVQAFSGTIAVDGGAGGVVPPTVESYAGAAGAPGTSFAGDFVPTALTLLCP